MSTAKKLLDIYINSSIHVALAVISLAIITTLHHNLRPDFPLLGFIFFGTVTGYNFVKYSGVVKMYHRNLAKSLEIIRLITFLCIIGLLISLFLIPLDTLVWACGFGLLTLLYALPVFSRRRNLRSFSGLKIFIIAFVWAGVTVILPLSSSKNVIFEASVLEFVQRFLLVLVWILPFEIRDLKFDLQQLGTIPQRVGVTRTKIFGVVLLLLVVGLEFWKKTASLETILALIFAAIVSLVLVWKSKENQSLYFASFWVEGIPILWLMFLFVLTTV